MFIPIPTSQTVTATVAGRQIKAVECAHCGQKYVYEMQRKISHSVKGGLLANSQKLEAQAANAAAKSLEYALNETADMVPCPVCGFLQADMIRQWRSTRVGIWIVVSLFLFVISAFIWFTSTLDRRVVEPVSNYVFQLAVWGPMILILIAIRMVNHNRNPAARTRERLGARCRGILLEELEQAMRESGEQAP